MIFDNRIERWIGPAKPADHDIGRVLYQGAPYALSPAVASWALNSVFKVEPATSRRDIRAGALHPINGCDGVKDSARKNARGVRASKINCRGLEILAGVNARGISKRFTCSVSLARLADVMRRFTPARSESASRLNGNNFGLLGHHRAPSGLAERLKRPTGSIPG